MGMAVVGGRQSLIAPIVVQTWAKEGLANAISAAALAAALAKTLCGGVSRKCLPVHNTCVSVE